MQRDLYNKLLKVSQAGSTKSLYNKLLDVPKAAPEVPMFKQEISPNLQKALSDIKNTPNLILGENPTIPEEFYSVYTSPTKNISNIPGLSSGLLPRTRFFNQSLPVPDIRDYKNFVDLASSFGSFKEPKAPFIDESLFPKQKDIRISMLLQATPYFVPPHIIRAQEQWKKNPEEWAIGRTSKKSPVAEVTERFIKSLPTKIKETLENVNLKRSDLQNTPYLAVKEFPEERLAARWSDPMSNEILNYPTLVTRYPYLTYLISSYYNRTDPKNAVRHTTAFLNGRDFNFLNEMEKIAKKKLSEQLYGLTMAGMPNPAVSRDAYNRATTLSGKELVDTMDVADFIAGKKQKQQAMQLAENNPYKYGMVILSSSMVPVFRRSKQTGRYTIEHLAPTNMTKTEMTQWAAALGDPGHSGYKSMQKIASDAMRRIAPIDDVLTKVFTDVQQLRSSGRLDTKIDLPEELKTLARRLNTILGIVDRNAPDDQLYEIQLINTIEDLYGNPNLTPAERDYLGDVLRALLLHRYTKIRAATYEREENEIPELQNALNEFEQKIKSQQEATQVQ